MISWLTDAIRTRCMVPLTLPTVAVGDRAYIDDVGTSAVEGGDGTAGAPALDNELVISSATTQPVSSTIGGGGTLRHVVTVDLTAAGGDIVECRQRCERLVSAFLLPVMRDPSLGAADDAGATTGIAQELTSLTWMVQWADLEGRQQLASMASVSMTADCDWRPATLTA